MGIDLPPNLAGQTASAIVRQAEKSGKQTPTSQADKNKKDAGRDAGNASIRRKNEPGQK